MYDLIVIGGGPAGLTATVYALRKRLNVLLVSKDLGGKTNYRMQLPQMDQHLVINGEEVISRFVNEIQYVDFARVLTEVEKIIPIAEGYQVALRGGREVSGRALILATGAYARRLGVPGEQDFLMRGLSYSAISYGSMFVHQTVVVIGDGALALRAAADLARVAQRVTLVMNSADALASPVGRRLQALPNMVILDGHRVEQVKGDTFARSVVAVRPNGAQVELHADGFFVELGLMPNTDLVRGLVALDAQGRVEVDARNRTSAPGLFAAGDVTNVYAEQVLIAIGEGAKASLSAYEYLLEQPNVISTPVEAREWR